MSEKKAITFIGFYVLGISWGVNFIFMKNAIDYIDSMQTAFLRIVFGLIPVIVIGIFQGAFHKKYLRYLHHFFVMGMLASSLYYFGFAKGAELLPSGIAGTISGAVPIFAFILAVMFVPEEKFTLLTTCGVAIAFIGVAIISYRSDVNVSSVSIDGVLYMVGGSLLIGYSFIYAKKFIAPLKISVLILSVWQMIFGLCILIPLTNFQGMTEVFSDIPVSVGLIIGLGVIGTGLTNVIYYYLISKMGAITASSVTYIPPVVALLVGVFIAGEDIRIIDYFAAAFILGGVALVRRAQAM